MIFAELLWLFAERKLPDLWIHEYLVVLGVWLLNY